MDRATIKIEFNYVDEYTDEDCFSVWVEGRGSIAEMRTDKHGTVSIAAYEESCTTLEDIIRFYVLGKNK